MAIVQTVEKARHRKKKRKQEAGSPPTHAVYRKGEFAKSVKHELRCTTMLKTLAAFVKLIPRIIWTFFIEALLVASFRYEWGKKFRNWNAWVDLDHHEHGRVGPAPESMVKETKYSKHMVTPADEPPPMVHSTLQKHDHQNCSRLRINVGGQMFETQLRTLNRYPQSLLGDPNRRIVFYDPGKQYYFFDRNRACFENILYFFQSGGRLICPREASADEFLDEIDFFDLGGDVAKTFSVDEGLEQEDELASIRLPKNLLQRKLWLLLEYPSSSAQATLVSIISVYVILISVIVFCIETEPMFRNREGQRTNNNTSNNATVDDEFEHIDFKDPLTILETICVSWFTSELLLRCAVCPDKYIFFRDVMNIIDILAILPYMVSWVSEYTSSSGQRSNEAASFTAIRVIRLVRVFRIFKLSRHVKGLKILGWTLKASFNELGLLIFFLLIGVILFSSAVYFAEEGPHSDFQSIPHAFFWAVTTMTTVGYGDMVPIQVWGKIVGSTCAIAGVLTLALPVPVMVSNFNYFYNQEISRTRSMVDHLDTIHVQMCPYLPNSGIEPVEQKKSPSIMMMGGEREA